MSAQNRLPSVDEWAEKQDRRRRQQLTADADFDAGWWTAYDADTRDEGDVDASDAFAAGFTAGWEARP